MVTSSLLHENCTTFKIREEKQYCIHRKILPQLHCEEFPILKPFRDENEEDTFESEPIAILSIAPLCVAVFSGQ